MKFERGLGQAGHRHVVASGHGVEELLRRGGSLTVLDLPWSALSIPEESGA